MQLREDDLQFYSLYNLPGKGVAKFAMDKVWKF
jgi:hypothetical protein